MSESTLSRIEAGADLTVEIAENNLRRLHAEVSAVLEAASIPIDTITELAGPNPAPLPAQLRTMLNMGTGYFRTVNATIERLFRERNTRRIARPGQVIATAQAESAEGGDLSLGVKR